MLRSVVIVGAGHAGLQASVSLRQAGFDGRISLVGEETYVPYHRPPLSKAFLKDQAAQPDSVLLRSSAFLADASIDWLGGERVVSIDPSAGRAILQSGSALDFDHLIMATGAANRALPSTPPLENLISLRSMDDALRLRAALASASSLIVIGGGFIGLEIASTAIGMGKRAVVVEAATRLMARAVTPAMSGLIERMHADSGLIVRTGCMVSGVLVERGNAVAIELHTGEKLDADLIVVGIGAIPNTALAAEAGLPTDDGVVVDQRLRTGADNISAIGDCARFPLPGRNRRYVRLESVQNANDQARHVAAGLMGMPSPYDTVPWFWSDQVGAKIQMAGLAQDVDRTICVGSASAGKQTVLGFAGERLVCVETINNAADHMAARKLLGAAAGFSPDDAGPDFDLAAYVRNRSKPV